MTRDRRAFRHAHDAPEIPPHRRHWPKSKCKRNKGRPHSFALDARIHPPWEGDREWKPRYVYRRVRYVDGQAVRMRLERAFSGEVRTIFYRCEFCGKEDYEDEWRNVPAELEYAAYR